MAAMHAEAASLQAASAEMQTKIAQLGAALSDLQGAKDEVDATLDTVRAEKRQLEDIIKVTEATAHAAVETSEHDVFALRAVNDDCAIQVRD